MTTIAWDGTTLAADRMAVHGGTNRMVRKLFDCGDYWYAGAGNFDEVYRVADWLRGGANAKAPVVVDEACIAGIAVRKSDAAAYVLEGKNIVMTEVRRAPESTGSGHQYARAAMHLGKTASQAVVFASRFDVYTGMGVDSVRIVPRRSPRRKAR